VRTSLGLSSLLIAAASATAAPGKPNVVFLFADDHRADCLGAFGHPAVKTPHLDTLVKRGLTFPNAYCLGANVGAVCTPSRNMLLSGRAYFRFAEPGKPPLASPDKPHFAGEMKKLGYLTYHHGKRGNTATKLQAEFDVNLYLKNDEAERRSGEPGKEIADRAIQFLTAERPKDKPFFLYLAFGNPHDPRVAAEAYRKQYDPAAIPLPKNFLPLHPFDNGELSVRDEKLAPWPRTEADVKKHLHDYYATITALDGHIGRVLATLKDQGLTDNTLIVFSADHGLAMGSHGLFGKQSLYEHSMKAPLVFAGPGIRAGTSDAACYLHDVFPTVVDLGGGSVPPGIDGRSLGPVIRNEKDSIRDAIFLAYRNVQRALRVGEWKLIRYPQVNVTQLFNLASDPDETKDLAPDPAHAGRVKSLLERMAQEQKRLGDTQPLTVASPKPAPITAEQLKSKK
jgi:arylsulfatase A-like enzyme